MNIEQHANDLLQALAVQRNQHADDAAGLYADLLAAQRRIAELEAELAKLKPANDAPAA